MMLPPKEIIVYMVNTFDLEDVNWGFQSKLAKNLSSKYSWCEIKYALDYYKGKGETVHSLGFLLYKDNMKDPVSLYHAEQNLQESEDSGERNRNRIRQNSQTINRTESVGYLFEESGEDN